MSRTLKLVESLLALGRNYQQVGRNQEALQVLHRLAGFHELPATVAEEAQARLAEIQLLRHRYRRARRHLRTVLLSQPDSARYHYLMATALDADEKGDPRRAAEHYRRSLDLDPKQPRCLRDYGKLALRLEQTEAGLQALRQAVELAPHDPGAVADLVEGLRQAGRPEDIRRTLRAALFRNPRDRRFPKLWLDNQFQELHDAQEAARHREASSATEPTMLLPFVRSVATPKGSKWVRHDPASPSSPPHISRTARQVDQTHAQ